MKHIMKLYIIALECEDKNDYKHLCHNADNVIMIYYQNSNMTLYTIFVNKFQLPTWISSCSTGI